jgi:hypothetical protein
MIDVFKFKSVPQDHFLTLRISPTSVYFGEVTYTTEHKEQVPLYPSTDRLEDLLTNSKIQKDRNGFGVQLFLDESGKVTSKMEGFWIDNRLHGSCNVSFPSAAEYQGKLIGDKREGFGKLTLPDQTSYQGFWHQDCMEGPGVFTSASHQLQGNFVNNLYVTRQNSFLNPFVEAQKAPANAKQLQNAAQIREHNIHAKNFRFLEAKTIQEVTEFGKKSFENDRFCFVVSQINSGWDFEAVMKGLQGVSLAVIDCQVIEYTYLNHKATFPGHLEKVKEQLRTVMEGGGVILINVDEAGEKEAQKALDVDFKALISTHKTLEWLFNLKNLKKLHNLPNEIGVTRLAADLSVLILTKWRLPRDLRPALAKQQVSNRFQYICNVHWGDMVILS